MMPGVGTRSCAGVAGAKNSTTTKPSNSARSIRTGDFYCKRDLRLSSGFVMLTYVQLIQPRDYNRVASTTTTVSPDSMPVPSPGRGAIPARRGLHIGAQIADP